MFSTIGHWNSKQNDNKIPLHYYNDKFRLLIKPNAGRNWQQQELTFIASSNAKSNT